MFTIDQLVAWEILDSRLGTDDGLAAVLRLCGLTGQPDRLSQA
jgi:hypothetical protein